MSNFGCNLELKFVSMTELTLNKTWPYTNPYEAFEKILKFFGGWDWNLESLNDSQHANYLRYWCLYDIDVVSSFITLSTYCSSSSKDKT